MITGTVFLVLTVAVGLGAWWYVRMLDARITAGRSGRNKSASRGAGGERPVPPGNSREKSLSVQDLWGVKDIRDGMIVFDEAWYRVLLKIGPIDYHIMNENEQHSIESVLMSCAMALGFRIQLFSTTELVDTKSCALAIRSFVEAGNVSDAMTGYGLSMYSYLTSMMQDRSVRNRPRYIAISYHTLEGYEDAFNELQRRAHTLIANLSRARITASLLTSEQVLNVLFRFNNRGRVHKPSDAVGEGAMDLIVTGRGGIQTDVLPGQEKQLHTA